jgi:hypothetical protein
MRFKHCKLEKKMCKWRIDLSSCWTPIHDYS